MQITGYKGVTEEEIARKEHDIWIGISLGNKFFTNENIERYIRWAVAHTKERVLVVVADAIHAFNLEIFDNRTPNAAMRRAMKLGDEKLREIEEVAAALPASLRERIHIARWSDVIDSRSYKRRLDIVKEFYKDEAEFRDAIIRIIKTGRKDRVEKIARLTEPQLDRLAEYVLHELPRFINGVQGYDDRVYTVIPYPKLTMLDDLFVGLNMGEAFPELGKRLEMTNRIGIVEITS